MAKWKSTKKVPKMKLKKPRKQQNDQVISKRRNERISQRSRRMKRGSRRRENRCSRGRGITEGRQRWLVGALNYSKHHPSTQALHINSCHPNKNSWGRHYLHLILHVRTLKPREVRRLLTQGHPAGKWQREELNPGHPILLSKLLATLRGCAWVEELHRTQEILGDYFPDLMLPDRKDPLSIWHNG